MKMEQSVPKRRHIKFRRRESPKRKNTTDCVIFTAFPLQRRLHERTAMLRYAYLACLANVRVGGTCNYHWTLKVTIRNTFTGTHTLFHADPLPHRTVPLFSHCDKHTLQPHYMNIPSTISGVLSLRWLLTDYKLCVIRFVMQITFYIPVRLS